VVARMLAKLMEGFAVAKLASDPSFDAVGSMILRRWPSRG